MAKWMLFVLLCFLPLSSFAHSVRAQSWVDLGADGTGETQSSGDIVHIWFYNDGVFAYFREDLAGAPNSTAFTYMIYLDKPAGGSYSRDFRLVYSSTTSELQRWDGARWISVAGITVATSTSPNRIIFNVSLSSIANPSIQQNTNVMFVNYPEDRSIGREWVDLVYGKKEVKVGNISVCNDAINLHVDIYGDAGWVMKETHLDVSKDQLQWFAPGQWPYGHALTPPTSHDSYVITLANIGAGQMGNMPPFGVEPEDVIFLMVHAVIDGETAYGDAFKSPFNYAISGDKAVAFISYEVIPELPWPTPLVFISAVVAAIHLIYKRRFRPDA